MCGMSRASTPPPGFTKLSVAALSETQDGVPIPDWHREIIRERLEEARSNSVPMRNWTEVRAELQDRLRSVRGG